VVDTISKDELEAMEGQTYVIGREGHIYIGDSSISRRHAELKILNGKIHLRDLNSSNGVFLVSARGAMRFREGYVSLQQPLLLGKIRCTVGSLLSTLGVLAG